MEMCHVPMFIVKWWGALFPMLCEALQGKKGNTFDVIKFVTHICDSSQFLHLRKMCRNSLPYTAV